MIKIKQGDVLNNKQLREIFKCAPQGGMRRSKKTNSLVLISNHTNFGGYNPYDDKWKDGVFHYTGMGTVGDQSLAYRQNKTLAESETNGVQLYLFEVHFPQRYEYKGQVVLASEPYQDEQPDSTRKMRKVWIFPLKLKEN